MKKNKKAYKYGTSMNYMETPAEALAEDHINKAKAEYEAQSNPLLMGMEAVGGILMDVGMRGIAAGGFGDPEIVDGDMGDSLGAGIFTDPDIFTAKMGKAGATGNVEVEGGEVFETMSGEAGEFKGPSHSEGGIDVTFDEPTNVYSDKILKDGKTMAARKKARLAQVKKAEKNLAMNPSDAATKNTYERTMKNIQQEELQDLYTQKLISTIAGSQSDQYGLTAEFGLFDWFGDMFNPEEDNKALATTFGDLLSIGGNMFSGISPLLTTLEQRATDTPNINAFKDFGKDALDVNTQAQEFADDTMALARKDIERNAVSAKRAARKTSRSANTMRATDLAISQGENQSYENVYENFADQMLGLLSQRATLENQQDQAVMSGEQARDLADRQDKDSFYTAKAQNLADLGTAIQQTGKDLNFSQQQKMMKKILDQLSKYGITFSSDGTMQNPQ